MRHKIETPLFDADGALWRIHAYSTMLDVYVLERVGFHSELQEVTGMFLVAYFHGASR